MRCTEKRGSGQEQIHVVHHISASWQVNMKNQCVPEETLPRPGIEPTTFRLKDQHSINFAKELTPLARVVITQASQSQNTLLHSTHPGLCLSLKTGHPPLQSVLASSQSKPNPCPYWNTVSLSLGDSTISGAISECCWLIHQTKTSVDSPVEIQIC